MSNMNRTGRTMAMVLAGGAGTRLEPLTRERAKPAVPFGGRYRIIDFALSNFVNSEIYHIKVLTQYKSDSLNNHLSRSWRMTAFLGHYCETVPAQMRGVEATPNQITLHLQILHQIQLAASANLLQHHVQHQR